MVAPFALKPQIAALYGCPLVRGREIRVQDFSLGHSIGDHADNSCNGNAQTTNAGDSSHQAGLGGNSFKHDAFSTESIPGIYFYLKFAPAASWRVMNFSRFGEQPLSRWGASRRFSVNSRRCRAK